MILYRDRIEESNGLVSNIIAYFIALSSWSREYMRYSVQDMANRMGYSEEEVETTLVELINRGVIEEDPNSRGDNISTKRLRLAMVEKDELSDFIDLVKRNIV